MTRTAAREMAVQLCFRLFTKSELSGEALDSFFDADYFSTLSGEDGLFSELPDEKQMAYIRTVAQGVAARLEELDDAIGRYARGWKPERISKTAMAVLRVALYELQYMDEVPNAAAINEAVELAKGYDEPETVAFINGVLGAFVRGELGMTDVPETELPEMPDAPDGADDAAAGDTPAPVAAFEADAPEDGDALADAPEAAEADAPDTAE